MAHQYPIKMIILQVSWLFLSTFEGSVHMYISKMSWTYIVKIKSRSLKEQFNLPKQNPE
jgi:hypothetical protein